MSQQDNNKISYCMMCMRTEKDAGRLIRLPGNMTICPDCMQRTMDMMSNSDLLRQIPTPPGMDLNSVLSGFWGGFTGNGGTADTDGSADPAGEAANPVPASGTVSGADIPGGPFAEAPSSAEAPGGSFADAPKGAETAAPDVPFADAPGGTDQGSGTGSSGNIPAAAETAAPGRPGMDIPDGPETSDRPAKERSEGRTDNNRPRGISIFNLGSLFGQPPVQQHRSAPKKKPAGESILDLKSIPAPHKIRAMLDQYVIGQDHAKKVLSVAVYNHYKRIFTNTMDEIQIEKSNVLMLGPTGCGKTYLVRTLANVLNVPLAISDATSLTEAGYIGDDIESVVSRLLMEADDDVERCERGIVFIDEIDKLAKKKETNHRDVSGESVQQGLLSLLEGSSIEVPVGAMSKNAMVPMATVNTRNILFICAGAFPGLEDIIKERMNRISSIGFRGQLKDQYDEDPDILTHVTPEDLRKFGMIPEFIGRLPVICPLRSLTKETLISIMMEPKNAILRQYQKLLELDEVKLIFDDSALEAIAEKAMERKTGARGLRAVIEEFMLDIMYEIPKDENIGTVTITGDYIRGTGGPLIAIRGT